MNTWHIDISDKATPGKVLFTLRVYAPYMTEALSIAREAVEAHGFVPTLWTLPTLEQRAAELIAEHQGRIEYCPPARQSLPFNDPTS